MTEVQIAPSVLAANFGRLAEDMRAAEAAGADRLHYDVMDGRFVPNISMGPGILEAVSAAVSIPVEAHLMIAEPERYVEQFVAAGASLITVHVEASPHLYRVLEQIHTAGARAGVALNPATPWSSIEEVLSLADLVLVMTVSPGFGGQRFIGGMTQKLHRVREALDARGLSTELEVDGGIDVDTARVAVEMGARVLVAGTSVFRDPRGVGPALESLRRSASGALAAGNMTE